MKSFCKNLTVGLFELYAQMKPRASASTFYIYVELDKKISEKQLFSVRGRK
jgi:hypothetical protein